MSNPSDESAYLRVRLDGSDNQRLQYPCCGVLQLFEVGSNGQIIVAVFKQDGPGGPVVVKNPQFAYPARGEV